MVRDEAVTLVNDLDLLCTVVMCNGGPVVTVFGRKWVPVPVDNRIVQMATRRLLLLVNRSRFCLGLAIATTFDLGLYVFY